ncbi:hypothetical protein KUV22_15815 [Microbulbifer agarilyticus]|uniref:hypothetical protein n=1 Tax=Microbulbifer agarilyticus TaxID=260552 RepID=UPI001C968920|nr:hypothetical protein [Microbulbifer agarilyticus]MBY6191895.1 hypothetical protein [Microbulbifer agarilyticus]
MKKILYISLNIAVLIGIFAFVDSWYAQKIEILGEICQQESKNMLDEVVDTGIDPAFKAINNLELLKGSGVDKLVHSYDLRIDFAVSQVETLRNLEISDSKIKSLDTLLYRAKKLRMKYPSTAIDSKYYQKANEILDNVVLEQVKPESEGSIKERLEQLREMAKERRAQEL